MRTFIERGYRSVRQPNFGGLLVATGALGMAYSFVIPFLSLWGTKEIGMTPFFFGIFMTITSLSGILVSTGLARWSDTHGTRKTMLILGGVGGMLGYLGYALVRDPRFLILVGATVLALASVSFSQLFAHVRESFSGHDAAPGEAGLRMSLVRVCFSIAWTVGPALGAWMVARHGFRGLFLGAAGLYALFLLGVLRFVPFQRRPQHERTVARLPVWRVLTRGDIGACFAAFVLFFAASTINMMNLPLMVTTLLGGTPKDLGIIFGVGPVVEIPLMLWFGHLATRGHQLSLIRLGAFMAVLYFSSLMLVHAPWHIYPAQVISGVVFAILSNVAIIFFQDLVPGETGLATTIFSNASNVGSLVGYFSFGALIEWAGYRGVCAICAAAAVAMLGILLAYRPRAQAAGRAAA